MLTYRAVNILKLHYFYKQYKFKTTYFEKKMHDRVKVQKSNALTRTNSLLQRCSTFTTTSHSYTVIWKHSIAPA